tara:strand:- start:1295 stop:2224 length:930 start_codon:yes stop_codon:yes gene_type:complete
MSNILIIKLGSLGDIVQISGVLRDIRENHYNKKIFILTTSPYVELLSKCPHIDGVLIDKRLPRWNLLYLVKLRKLLSKFNFSKVFDLQNSSRTSFYRKFLLNNPTWNSSEIAVKRSEKKNNSNNEGVLERFNQQLIYSDIKTKHTLRPDFSWAAVSVDKIVNQYFGKKFILLFPFCSPQLSHKKWPFYNNLIKILKLKHPSYEIVIAPSGNEMDEAKKIDATIITKNNNPLNIMELAGLITKASYVIGNDTGPAHMAAHLGQKGTVLFGYHTTPKKVSIETEKFKAITVEDLNLLNAEEVYAAVKNKLN